MVVLDKTDVRSVCLTFQVVNRGVMALAQIAKEFLKIRLWTKIQILVALLYRVTKALYAILLTRTEVVMSLSQKIKAAIRPANQSRLWFRPLANYKH